MKKENEPKAMTELGILNHWPEMVYKPGWEDEPLPYVVTEKGQQDVQIYRHRQHIRKNIWKPVLIMLAFFAGMILLGYLTGNPFF